MTGSSDRPALLIEERFDGPTGVRVLADGEVDLETAPMLRSAIADALRANKRVAVDLRAVTFLDSTGVAALLAAAESARRDSVELEIEVSRVVRRVLELTGVDSALPLRR